MFHALSEQLVNVDIIDPQHVDKLHTLATLQAVLLKLRLQSLVLAFQLAVLLPQGCSLLLESVEVEVVAVGSEGL